MYNEPSIDLVCGSRWLVICNQDTQSSNTELNKFPSPDKLPLIAFHPSHELRVCVGYDGNDKKKMKSSFELEPVPLIGKFFFSKKMMDRRVHCNVCYNALWKQVATIHPFQLLWFFEVSTFPWRDACQAGLLDLANLASQKGLRERSCLDHPNRKLETSGSPNWKTNWTCIPSTSAKDSLANWIKWYPVYPMYRFAYALGMFEPTFFAVNHLNMFIFRSFLRLLKSHNFQFFPY